MDVEAPERNKSRTRATATGAFLGFVFGSGGGIIGAILSSVVIGGIFYVVSGVFSRSRSAASAHRQQSVSVPRASNVDKDASLHDVWGVLEEALNEGIISETGYHAIGAIARRRILGQAPMFPGEIARTAEQVRQTRAPVAPPETPPAEVSPPSKAQEPVREARRPEPPKRPSRPTPTSPAAQPIRKPPPPVRVEPSRIAVQLRRIWQTLISDFALHGLAYAGVLLVFVATLGFVIFAFSGVQSGLRPVAEGVIPVMLFGAAHFLRNRGAPLVSRSLMLLAGAVTPVVIFAAFQDGAPFPPDVDGAPLLLLLTFVSLGLATVYARVSATDSGSPLRFLVAPLVWVAVGVVGIAFHAEPSAAQMSLVIVAIAGTALLAKRMPEHTLSKPTLDVILPATGIAYLLLVLFAAAEGWPAIPPLAAGLALLAFSEILRGQLRYAAIVQAVVIAATAGLVVPAWGVGVAGAGAAVAFVAFTEVWALRPDPRTNLPLGASLGLGALLLAFIAPWPMMISGSIVALWGHVRRRTAPQQDGMDDEPKAFIIALAMAAAVIAPALAAGALLRTVQPELGLLVVSAITAVAALAVWRWAREDVLYALFIPVAAGAIAVGSVVVQRLESDPAYGVLAGAAGLAAFTFALAPRWPVVRIWFGAVTALWAVALGLEAAEVALEFRAPTMAVLGAISVLASTAGRDRSFGHLTIVGHLTTAGALLVAEAGGPALITLAAFSSAWIVETFAGETGRSPLRDLIEHVTPPLEPLRWVFAGIAPAIASISVPFLVADLATFFKLVTTDQRGRMALLLAALALGYAGIARLTVARRPLAPILTLGGFFLSGVAVAVAAPQPWPTITALVSSIAVVALVGGELRRPAMTWIAWAMSAILSILLADRLGVGADRLHLVLLGWGTAGLLGGLAVDDIRSGRRDRGAGLRLDWVIRPVALGALAIPVALSFALDSPPADAWVSAAVAAVVYAIASVQLRAGSTSAVFYGLGAYAIGLRLADTSLDVAAHPWMLSFFTLVLVAIAFVFWLATEERSPLLRWDVPPLVVAHATALLALALTAEAGSVPAVFAAHGGIALAVAAWQRRWLWAVGGAGLLLVGAAVAGPGWLALVTGGLAVLATVSATISTRYWQPLQWAGVGLSGWAWAEAVVWLEWWPDPALLVTAIGGGVLALAMAGGVRAGWLPVPRVTPWVALAVLAVLGTEFVVLTETGSRADGSLGVAIGLVGLAAASALAARPFDPVLRPLAGILAGVAGPVLVYGYAPSGGTVAALAAPVGLAAALAGTLLWRSRLSLWAPPALLFSLITYATGIISGAEAAAHGWLAVLIGSGAVAAWAGALVTENDTRWQLQTVSALATVAAWSQVVAWANWWPEPGVNATILGAALGGLVLALLLRFRLLDRSWALTWGVLAALTTATGIGLLGHVAQRQGGLAAAGGLLIWTAAMALAARPLDVAWLREGAAVSLIASGAALGYALEPSLNRQVASSLLVGLAAIILTGGLRLTRPQSLWIRPGVIYATVVHLGALLAAARDLPDSGLLSASLAAVGIEMLVLGGLLGLSAFLYAGPSLLLGSWMLFAADALSGNPQWYTIPIGITILVLVDILRWDFKRRGEEIPSPVVAYADYAGMAFMVGASLIQIIVRTSAHGLVAIVAGLVILGWSAASRLRRRAWGGAAAIVAASVLMLAVPLARIVPQFRGIALWATIAAIGAALITVASTLEQGKARVAQTVKRLDELMEGWE